ncbi:MAG TPA: DUF1295 domain-containing protein [Anaeromyxobacter sp.]
MTAALAASGVAAVLIAFAAWGASLRLRDASIADVVWGPAIAGLGWIALALGPGTTARGTLLVALATVWAARLAVHLARRRRGKGEDRRYRAMRERHGARFATVSLFTVFLVQAGLQWAVAAPLLAAASPGMARPLGPLDAIGAALFGAGFLVEALADAQLARFLSDRGAAGRVMDRGLWRWSRHPNYFGEAVLWWGLGVVAAAGGAPWALAGPLLLTLLLLRVSGVTLLESTIADRRPGYAEYVARTSAFVPRPPRAPDPR